MENTFNCHCNASMVVSSGEEMHILFLLRRPVLKGDKPEMETKEQVLITIPLGYAEALGNAILSNYNEHKKNEEKAKSVVE